MDNAKDKGSRSGSKTNLNESSLPLLDQEEVDLKGFDDKVAIEMEARVPEDTEKADATKEEGEGKDDYKEDKKNKKKEKKEKKKSEKKEDKGHKRTSSLAERLTAGLNLLDRDDRNVNDHVNIVFDDVLAEPDSNHGFDVVWRLAFIVFSGTKLWVYRVISALLAIPCGLLWGIIFSFLALLNVWLISPTLRTFDVLLHITRKVWSGIIHTFLDPVFQSVGQLFSSINVSMVRQEIIKDYP